MALFTESGQGRKQCPGCKMYNGVRTVNCENCNREFTAADKKVRPPANFYEEGGVGRKLCVCGKYVGAKTLVCPNCNHDFKAGRADVAEPKTIAAAPVVRVTGVNQVEPITPSSGLGRGVILTPSGPCPFKLESTETAAVEQWAGNVTAHYRRQGRKLDASALRYFAGTFYAPHTPEYVDVVTTLSLMD